MTESEITDLIRVINATYPSAKPILPIAFSAWLEDLSDIPLSDARAAFAAWRRQGGEFPPNPGQLRSGVAQLASSAVTFEQVWGVVQNAVRLYGGYRESDAMRALETLPEASALVDLMGGWGCVCQGGPSAEKPMDAGVWWSQARNAYRAWQEQRRADLAMLDLPGRRGEAARLRVVDGFERIDTGEMQRVLSDRMPTLASHSEA